MSSEQDAPNLWDDERITAYVLNELDEHERETFEAELRLNPPLAEAVEKARVVTGKLDRFFAAIPKETLEGQRLQSLLAERPGTETESTHSDQPRSGRSPWLSLAVAAGIVFVLAAISIPVITSTLSPSSNVAMTTADSSAREGMTSSVPEQEEELSFAMEPIEIAALDASVSSDRDQSNKLPNEVREAMIHGQMKPGDGLTALTAKEKKAQPYIQEAKKSQFGAMADPAPAVLAEQPLVELAAPADVTGQRYSRRGRASNDELDMGMDMGMDMDMDMDMGMVMRGEGIANSRQQDVAKKPAMGMDMGMGMDMAGLPGLPGIDLRLPGDRYATIDENTFKRVTEHPLSTLSIDVDTASYSKVRMALQRNQLPSPDAVRIEEMINYFEYDYKKIPDTLTEKVSERFSDPFSAHLDVTECPWQPEHRLVRVGLQAIDLDKQERPRCNLVFLIDTSGSMRATNKLPLLIDGMKLLVQELRPDDQVAIVVYAGSAGLVLESTPAAQSDKIISALSRLEAGGSTNGGAGLRLAYETARESFIQEGVNRVILCSDGDFNVGMTGTDELVREAKSQAKSGVELTVLGFGMGNHNDAMMEKISNDAEGNYAFVDTIAEAKKVLGDQLSGTLVTVAKDVKIQIEFNPAVVSSYRLIGYENRLLAKEDFNDDTKDAGEIGAGHRVTALYQVVPAGAKLDPATPPVDALKYQQPKPVQDEPSPESTERVSNEMLTLKLRYKPPQGTKSTLMERTLTDDGGQFGKADDDFQFAAAVAGFGMLLRNSPMAGSWTYEDVMKVAADALGTDEHGLREEMIELAAIAKRLSE
ncbi:VWA domain-containing protein [Neorhodopirellula pilleata]|uniref:von Willebrand factor n=1 Tax=Neorhodopirellula pilleata TaxID=2714738 RepID=A0A5C6ASK0_9BACT|nr:VWA domain-containing protein [Neorhodopirellula pilleata]TWU02046.1 von Willebrand factor [Neorhodopirellula pilleata]